MKLSIINGHLVDPNQNLDGPCDLHIDDGVIVALGSAPADFSTVETIDASGEMVCAGFIDLQARLREPGETRKGNIRSETLAAAHGGITTLAVPPDTRPVIDHVAIAEQILHRAECCGSARVLPQGAMTRNLAGEQLSEMVALTNAGCIAISNARRAITNTLVMRRAMEYAASHDILLILQSDEAWLSQNGVINEGELSARLGLTGIPEIAEVIGVSRDLYLIEESGVRAHFGQISSARAIRLIAEAQQRGLKVTADIAIHQLLLTEKDADNYNSLYHLIPPLRTQRDRDGLQQALREGLFSGICSDHQPHEPDAKLAPFAATEPGISSLETLLPLTLRLVREGVLTLSEAIAHLTIKPARTLGIESQYGDLQIGTVADITIFDPQRAWILNNESMLSQGKNTPFMNWEMQGEVTHTLLAGRQVYPTP